LTDHLPNNPLQLRYSARPKKLNSAQLIQLDPERAFLRAFAHVWQLISDYINRAQNPNKYLILLFHQLIRFISLVNSGKRRNIKETPEGDKE
jgi:hypothetical protein